MRPGTHTYAHPGALPPAILPVPYHPLGAAPPSTHGATSPPHLLTLTSIGIGGPDSATPSAHPAKRSRPEQPRDTSALGALASVSTDSALLERLAALEAKFSSENTRLRDLVVQQNGLIAGLQRQLDTLKEQVTPEDTARHLSALESRCHDHEEALTKLAETSNLTHHAIIQLTKDRNTLQEETKDLRDEIVRLETEIADFKAETTEAQDTLRGEVAGLKAETTEARDALRGEVAGLKAEIAGLKAEITTTLARQQAAYQSNTLTLMDKINSIMEFVNPTTPRPPTAMRGSSLPVPGSPLAMPGPVVRQTSASSLFGTSLSLFGTPRPDQPPAAIAVRPRTTDAGTDPTHSGSSVTGSTAYGASSGTSY